MSLPEVMARERHGVLAVTVWFEGDRDDGFRARVRTIGQEGDTAVLGVTSVREQVIDRVRQWLESVGEK